MNTTEKLQRIRARCVELLAIAEKRTPGEWQWVDENDEPVDYSKRYENVVPEAQDTHLLSVSLRSKQPRDPSDRLFPSLPYFISDAEEITKPTAAFIAACAGAAEAGWRSTIAAIDGLLASESLIYNVQNDYDESPPNWWIEQRTKVLVAQNAILTAWEGLV